ncbi:DUF3990 domain-containing protein [Bacteroides congonensis]|uniref:DUF3990 domain-containing protein n=1 Tax=Bacteroides congonensis TaxID=1871006 RepID=UPI0024B0B574|nr:DUF3990 domain-containing protein [Bacteroides congonensis]
MKLYHASSLVIKQPDVYHSREHLDFGKGFYLTSLYDQAYKYAMRFLLRRQKAYINDTCWMTNYQTLRLKSFKVMMKNGWTM